MEIQFFDGINMTAGELFHTMGHECVHVKQFATGEYYEWKEK